MTASIALPIAFVFGACLGSFLNVCIWRLPRRCMSIDKPRGSFCPSCRSEIPWYLNLPILSWLILRGRCASCRSPIRFRYPMVETLTAVLFLVAAWMRLVEPAWSGPIPWTVYAALACDFYLVAAVVVLSFVDLDLHIIPDEVSLPAVPIGLLAGALAPTHLMLANSPAWFGSPQANGLVAAALGMVAGGGTLWLMGTVGRLLLRKEAMGMGDVKLMAGFGCFLGWDGVLVAFLLASVTGSLLAGIRFMTTRSHHLAFGPYLALGTLVTRFLDDRAYRWFGEAAEWVIPADPTQPGHIGLLWLVLGGLMAYLLAVLVMLRRDNAKKQAEFSE